MSDSKPGEEIPAIELNASNLTIADHDEIPLHPTDDEYPSGFRLYIVFLALALSVLIVGLVSVALLRRQRGRSRGRSLAMMLIIAAKGCKHRCDSRPSNNRLFQFPCRCWLVRFCIVSISSLIAIVTDLY